jgi:hypothetical protein
MTGVSRKATPLYSSESGGGRGGMQERVRWLLVLLSERADSRGERGEEQLLAVVGPDMSGRYCRRTEERGSVAGANHIVLRSVIDPPGTDKAGNTQAWSPSPVVAFLRGLRANPLRPAPALGHRQPNTDLRYSASAHRRRAALARSHSRRHGSGTAQRRPDRRGCPGVAKRCAAISSRGCRPSPDCRTR